MLTVLVGDNTPTIFKRVAALHQHPHPNRFDHETFSESEFLTLVQSTGLFDESQVIILRDVISKTPYLQTILSQAGPSSPHKIICIEESLSKELLKNLDQHNISIEEFSLPKNTRGRAGFNLFGITDAAAARNKKQAWLLYQSALSDNIAAEEIHGLLVWQFKQLLLVARSDGNPGLKPFVYNKTKSAISNFSQKELQEYLAQLVRMYHDVRRDGSELRYRLEQFLLRL